MVTIHTQLSTLGKINAKKIRCFVHYMIRPIRPSFIDTVLKAEPQNIVDSAARPTAVQYFLYEQ